MFASVAIVAVASFYSQIPIQVGHRANENSLHNNRVDYSDNVKISLPRDIIPHEFIINIEHSANWVTF